MSEQDVIERLERLENLIAELIESVALLMETTDTTMKLLADQVSHLALQLGVNQDEDEEEQEAMEDDYESIETRISQLREEEEEQDLGE